MSKNRILTSIKGCYSATKFGLIIFILFQYIEQNEILTSIKGHNPVTNLRKMKLYDPNIDLIINDINDNVHTKFG